jgi:kynurenine formamidase
MFDLSRLIGMIVLLTLAGTTHAQYEDVRHPHESMSNWGQWGPEDQKGAANYISPEAVVTAAKLIRSGKSFSLAIPLDSLGPVFPGRTKPVVTTAVTGVDYGEGEAPGFLAFTHFADDYLHMPLQGSTQWDGLSHGWYGEQLYNGFSNKQIHSSPWFGGATVLGIENIKDSLIGRGVLIDIVRHKGGSLPRGYSITRADIEGALKEQGTQVLPGDIVVLRTGVVPGWYKLKGLVEQAHFWEAQAGIVKDVIPWIKEKKIAGMAADNISLERNPHPEHPELGTPLHGNIIRDLGVYIGEIWWLEELAEDCAKDGRYEFFLAAQPLNIPGGVGSPLNPVAIK